MSEKKYQVFVSSTYEDLKEERAAVITALLKDGFIPVCMEYFTASNKTQWEVIESIIPQCDYYVIIVAGKYGSIEETTGISYTQKEYELAYSKGVPCLGFVHGDILHLPAVNVEENPDKRTKLKAFTDLVKSRMCNFWREKNELAANVITSLHKALKDTPRTGWLPADQNIAEQYAALQAENKALKAELQEKADQWAFGDETFTLTYRTIPDIFSGEEEHIIYKSITWKELFLNVAPTLLSPVSVAVLESKLSAQLSTEANLTEDTTSAILAQLIALDLITTESYSNDYYGHTVTYALSQKGMKAFAEMRAIKRKTETNESPVLKLIRYSQLKPEEFKQAYSEVVTMLKNGQITDPAALAHVVSIFAKLDALGIPLTVENQKLLEDNIYSVLYVTGNQDDLYDAYLKYARVLNGNGYDKATDGKEHQMLQYFHSTNNKLKNQFKTKLVGVLENLTDENALTIRELHHQAPDHGALYSSMALFNQVDTDKLFKGIVKLSPSARYEIGIFLAERYNLMYQLAAPKGFYSEDLSALQQLQQLTTIHINGLYPIERLSFKDFCNILILCVERCKGNLKKMI